MFDRILIMVFMQHMHTLANEVLILVFISFFSNEETYVSRRSLRFRLWITVLNRLTVTKAILILNLKLKSLQFYGFLRSVLIICITDNHCYVKQTHNCTVLFEDIYKNYIGFSMKRY